MANVAKPSAALADFIHSVEDEDIPEELMRVVELSFIDTLGVTLAGASEPAPQHVQAVVSDSSSGSRSKIIGADRWASPGDSGLVNGTAAHVLDYDDVSWAIDAHPSAPLVVGILAMSGVRDISGLEAIRAFIVGFESMCHLADPISPAHYESGWHATGTMGVFGTVAASAIVLDLSIDETRTALNIAASMPAGLKRNFGSMTKSLHVGRAVSSGIQATRLAAEGFTADSDAIGGDKGFLELYGGSPTKQLVTLEGDWDRWFLAEEGLHRKRYPCCYFTQSGIHAIQRLRAENGIEPDEIQSIKVFASQGAHDALPHSNPSTPLEAKFSMQYTVAFMAQHGRLDLEAFEEEAIADSAVHEMLSSVRLEVDPDLEYSDHGAMVVVETTGGAYELEVDDPPGSHHNPFSREELTAKFEDCAGRSLDLDRIRPVLDRLNELRSESSMVELSAMM